jgi:hypothetical protein
MWTRVYQYIGKSQINNNFSGAINQRALNRIVKIGCGHPWLREEYLSFDNILFLKRLDADEKLQYFQLPYIPCRRVSGNKTKLCYAFFTTKNERDHPLFTGKLLIKFQNILRNTTQVIIRHRVKILFSVISSPITLEWQKWKSSKMKGILLNNDKFEKRN